MVLDGPIIDQPRYRDPQDPPPASISDSTITSRASQNTWREMVQSTADDARKWLPGLAFVESAVNTTIEIARAHATAAEQLKETERDGRKIVYGENRNISEVKDSKGKTIEKVGQNGVESISFDHYGNVLAQLKDGGVRITNQQDEKSEFKDEPVPGNPNQIKRIFKQPPGTEVMLETKDGKAKAVKISFDTKDGKEEWTLDEKGTAKKAGGKDKPGLPGELQHATIDAESGTLTGYGQVKDARGKAENVEFKVKADGSWTENHKYWQKDCYQVTKDKNGIPIEVQHPVVEDGRVIEGSKKTFRFEYDRDSSGNVMLKDGKPVLNQIKFEIDNPQNGSTQGTFKKTKDGQWQLFESVSNSSTGQPEERPLMKDQKPVKWAANPLVKPDGSLVMTAPDGARREEKADGSVKTGKIAGAEQQRETILQIGTTKDGKPVWVHDGAPSPSELWGFDGWGAEKGTFGPMTFTGDQDYDFTISQNVDEKGNITRREVRFHKEGGITDRHRGTDGQMTAIQNVSGIVVERQPDGTYKWTYQFAGDKSGSGGEEKQVVLHTTKEGRYSDDYGMPADDRPQNLKIQGLKGESSSPESIASNAKGLQAMMTDYFKRPDADMEGAHALTKELLRQQMELEDRRIAEAAKQKDRRAQVAAEVRRQLYEDMRRDSPEAYQRRQEYINGIRKKAAA